MTKKAFIIITIIILCSISFYSFGVDSNNETNTTNNNANQNTNDLNQLNDKLNEIQNKVTTSNEELENVDNELSANLQQIEKIDQSILTSEQTMKDINDKINKITEEKETINNELQDITEKYNEQEETLKERLITQYENGKITYLDFLLNSNTLMDFISNCYLISELTEYDNNLLLKVDEQRSKIEEQRNILQAKEDELETQRKIQIKTETILENSRVLRETFIARLTEEEQKIQSEIDGYYKEIETIEQEIKSLAKVESFGTEYVGGALVWPIPGYTTITSEYGMRVHPITGVYKLHTGTDISAPIGADFVSMAYGMVIKAEYNSAYGNMVIIDHGGGVQTLYAHGSEILVQVGQVVNAGDAVLKVGSTGYSTGPHAHFEIRFNGETLNPMDYLKQ